MTAPVTPGTAFCYRCYLESIARVAAALEGQPDLRRALLRAARAYEDRAPLPSPGTHARHAAVPRPPQGAAA